MSDPATRVGLRSINFDSTREIETLHGLGDRVKVRALLDPS